MPGTTRPVANRAAARLARAAALLGLLALLVSAVGRASVAAEQPKIITIGESNTPEERQQLLDLFKATDDEEKKATTITVADTAKAMDGIFDMTGYTTAFSSTALTCRDLGQGLDVTTSNITVVTPGLYAMALVTAGIGDGTLVVAAPDGRPGVEGMTALTGVFKTWSVAPCESGDTSKARQRLALEELTLTVQIGKALQAAGDANGVQLATNVVLQTQQTIVTDGLKDKKAIDKAVSDQEKAVGVTIPADQRAELVDLMTRLAEQDIDWSTFAKGWKITQNADNTRITMTGDGIAIRNAQATATAEAGAMLTATAEAANAQATADAAAALTATAEAEPTATATPEPTATPQPTATPEPTPTPEPYAVTGKVVDRGDGTLVVAPEGQDTEASYAVDGKASITRGGKPADLAKLDRGDTVQMTVNGSTDAVTAISADPRPLTMLEQLTKIWWAGAMGLLLPAMIVYRRSKADEPFVVREIAR
ncbi:MAG: DUF1002 domain-containing protein [Chloroflexota bacterium]|nr:DUF1002 domain-containing protein [Chloroflexota bacterium]